jgi:hypothetical protein
MSIWTGELRPPRLAARGGWVIASGRRLMLPAISSLLIVYVGIYAILSQLGAYEPAAIGLNGVKWYAWGPRGCYDRSVKTRLGARARRYLMLTFAPLWWLDQECWHTERAQYQGTYPIHGLDYVDH